MIGKPTISIITAVYNIEKYLPTCLDSILAQTYPYFELIIVDDGSTDRSGIICDEYAIRDSRIVVFHQENKGVSDSWNIAINYVRSAYVGFVDGDDFIHPRMYELLYQAIKETGSDVAYCDFRKVSETDFDLDKIVEEYKPDTSKKIEAKAESIYAISDRDEEMKRIFRFDSGPYIWKGLYKASLVKQFRFISGRRAQDRLWSPCVILNAEQIVRLNRSLYMYRERPGSVSVGGRTEKILDHFIIRYELLQYLRNHAQEWVNAYLLELFSICIDTENQMHLLSDPDKKEEYRREINRARQVFSEISMEEIVKDPYTDKQRKFLAMIGKVSFPLACFVKRNLLKIINRFDIKF